MKIFSESGWPFPTPTASARMPCISRILRRREPGSCPAISAPAAELSLFAGSRRVSPAASRRRRSAPQPRRFGRKRSRRTRSAAAFCRSAAICGRSCSLRRASRSSPRIHPISTLPQGRAAPSRRGMPRGTSLFASSLSSPRRRRGCCGSAADSASASARSAWRKSFSGCGRTASSRSACAYYAIPARKSPGSSSRRGKRARNPALRWRFKRITT